MLAIVPEAVIESELLPMTLKLLSEIDNFIIELPERVPEPPAQRDTTLYEVHREGSIVPEWFTSLAKVKLEIGKCKNTVTPVSWIRKVIWDHNDTMTCHQSFRASQNFAGLD